MYKTFRPFARGTAPGIGDLLTMVIKNVLNGMILQANASCREYLPTFPHPIVDPM